MSQALRRGSKGVNRRVGLTGGKSKYRGAMLGSAQWVAWKSGTPWRRLPWVIRTFTTVMGDQRFRAPKRSQRTFVG